MVFSFLGSVGGVGVAGLFLLSPEKARQKLIPTLLGFATGTLLAAALLILIPEASESISQTRALATVLIGMLVFFVLEKLVILHHCHDEVCDVHHAAGPLVLIGDAFHNFVDGVVIAAAFLTSVPTGVAASLAAIAHEIPQELGDFAILLDQGYKPRRALFWNMLSGMTTMAASLLTYFALRAAQLAVPYTLAVAAASFLYIAAADLIPSLHSRTHPRNTFSQLALILIGVGLIVVVERIH